MVKNVFHLILLSAMSLFSCSRTVDVRGTWMNGEKNIITFHDRGKAILTQEGKSESQSGTYAIEGDTVFLSTAIGGNGESGRSSTRFFLRHDSLLLEKLVASPPAPDTTITAEHISLMRGIPREHFSFVRQTK